MWIAKRLVGKRNGRRFYQLVTLSLLSVVLLLDGCIAKTNVPLSSDGLGELKDPLARVYIVHYVPSKMEIEGILPDRPAVITGAVLGGAVGGAIGAMIDENTGGNSKDDVAMKYHLQDPVVIIKERFGALLENKLKISSLDRVNEPLPGGEKEVLKAKFGNDMVLDFQNLRWWLRWNDRVVFIAQGRLVALKAGKVLWGNACVYEEDKSEASQSREDLIAKDAALLKSKLKKAGEICADRMISHFLGKSSP